MTSGLWAPLSDPPRDRKGVGVWGARVEGLKVYGLQFRGFRAAP